MKKSLNNIVILGGGTAGWATALMAKKNFPESNITVIESEDIGILGAGEGTTFHFLQLLDYLEIEISDIFKYADATIKNAVKFTNWNNNNDFYYHGFTTSDLSTIGSTINPYRVFDKYNPYFNLFVSEDNSIENLSIYSTVSNQNKTPFKFQGDGSIKSTFLYGLHFNAAKLAIYLKQKGIERGIVLIEGKVIDIYEENKKISSLKLEDERLINLDFVFDCSGFHRKIIGNHFKSKWISHSHLPIKKAIPFFLDIKENEKIPPYTESIAMKHGWMWKIPTQKRFGCGYAYDSDLITEDQAREEIYEYLGYKIDCPRVIDFNAGFFEEQWISNCVAIGLSSGFIEPLEATSIWVSIIALSEAMANLDIFFEDDQRIINIFNQYMFEVNKQISDFIYFHYMTDRNDTDFWKHFKDENNIPKFIKDLLEKWQYLPPLFSDFSKSLTFHYPSWTQVALGTRNINKSVISNSAINNDLLKKFELEFAYTKRNHIEDLDLFMLHEDTIDYLGGKIEYK